MVRAIRSGASLRAVGAQFGVSPGTVRYWLVRAKGKRLGRVDLGNQKPGAAWNRVSPEVESRIGAIRLNLREHSVLGEYGPDAIQEALRGELPETDLPSRSTIHRVLARLGLLDNSRRTRRPAPPKGWYLPDLAAGKAELDSFDFIESLKIANGPLVDVLTGTSLHGALADAWIMPNATARGTLEALIGRWRREGLPGYAQFDNDTLFQGAHKFADSIGRVSRLCLSLGVVPVFAPPREPGFQNPIEGFNGLWQSKVWRRFHFADLQELEAASARYIAAHHAKTARRREAAPERLSFPRAFNLDLSAPLSGTMIFLRRTDQDGQAHCLGRTFPVSPQWVHRLVRCEVNFTCQRIRFYALRRRNPDDQPMLLELPYQPPVKPFRNRGRVCN